MGGVCIAKEGVAISGDAPGPAGDKCGVSCVSYLERPVTIISSTAVGSPCPVSISHTHHRLQGSHLRVRFHLNPQVFDAAIKDRRGYGNYTSKKNIEYTFFYYHLRLCFSPVRRRT